MDGINFIAVAVAAASAFLLGGIWYSPKVFGSMWIKEDGRPSMAEKLGHGGRVFICAYLLSFLAALTFAYFMKGPGTLQNSVLSGLVVGVCFASSTLGINYLFGGRTFKLFAIDAGYHISQFVLYGLILGLWS